MFASTIPSNQDDDIQSFHRAVRNNNYELVEELRTLVDINCLDQWQEPSLYYTIQSKQCKLAQLLITNGAKLDDDPRWNLSSRQTISQIIFRAIQDLYLLDECGANINTIDDFGNTALDIIL